VVFKWPSRPTVEEAKGDFDLIAKSLVLKLPAGAAGSFGGAEDTNSYSRRQCFFENYAAQTESQPGREAQANFHPERRSDRQMSFHSSVL